MLVQQHCRCSITTPAPVIMTTLIVSHTQEHQCHESVPCLFLCLKSNLTWLTSVYKSFIPILSLCAVLDESFCQETNIENRGPKDCQFSGSMRLQITFESSAYIHLRPNFKELMLVKIIGLEKELLNESSQGSRLTIFTRSTVASNCKYRSTITKFWGPHCNEHQQINKYSHFFSFLLYY